jgi:hypothetical protein
MAAKGSVPAKAEQGFICWSVAVHARPTHLVGPAAQHDSSNPTQNCMRFQRSDHELCTKTRVESFSNAAEQRVILTTTSNNRQMCKMQASSVTGA